MCVSKDLPNFTRRIIGFHVLINTIVNGASREDSTRIRSQGTVCCQAINVSSMHRVNQAIALLTSGARQSAMRNVKSIGECLADELINAAPTQSRQVA